MDSRLRPSLALLISALVHAGVAFLMIAQANRSTSAVGSATQRENTLTVSLAGLGHAASRDNPPLPALPSAKDVAQGSERHSPEVAVEHSAVAPGERAAERHYFAASEVTQQAVVAEGLFGGIWLIVPGLNPQEVTLQVWVRDDGMVERVELESPMEEVDRQLLLDAFAKVRFVPARIGHIAVHSRLSMRVLTDFTIRA